MRCYLFSTFQTAVSDIRIYSNERTSKEWSEKKTNENNGANVRYTYLTIHICTTNTAAQRELEFNRLSTMRRLLFSL